MFFFLFIRKSTIFDTNMNKKFSIKNTIKKLNYLNNMQYNHIYYIYLSKKDEDNQKKKMRKLNNCYY